MGSSATANLFFGFPVEKTDGDGAPTSWYDEEIDDVRELPDGMDWEFSGDAYHGDMEAFVRLTAAPHVMAWAYDGEEFDPRLLSVTRDALVAADLALTELGVPERFVTDGRWFLIASYG